MSPTSHAADRLPIVTASNGQPYLPCDAVLALLRAIAESCRNLADDPDCDLHSAGAAIDIEADSLEAHAIAHTTEAA
ncbi:hypothetical protein [Streptomyces europaeiscabiei]|uniref:hypothetical protein n=1 Tax=Streptomyces europaeiscabiei TaxID=146819 RepID=UPI0029A394C2|nr:hypothetical protein [Streptomyces europaeiscabiei]MDX2757880.1 hypothetical protein [Streptomyces europaeiscabiei]